jgi:hypothetical protein
VPRQTLDTFMSVPGSVRYSIVGSKFKKRR